MVMNESRLRRVRKKLLFVEGLGVVGWKRRTLWMKRSLHRLDFDTRLAPLASLVEIAKTLMGHPCTDR